MLDVLVQSRRNAVAAKKFFRRLLKGLRYVPGVIVTDKLASYQVAHRELMPSVQHPPDARAGAGPTACTRRSRRRKACAIQSENQTLASITFQNYFRMYGKLAGMTGTADTEAYEFQQIYGLETVVIPTHQPMIRKDQHDLVYRTLAARSTRRSINDIQDCHERGQPVLVGTTSIENSELLSGLLQKEKLPHQVLNAKQHAREARDRRAGRPAEDDHHRHQHGRPRHRHRARRQRRERRCEFVEADETLDAEDKTARVAEAARRVAGAARPGGRSAGGLHIIGTERHESRRIDNQLRGRSGRQGDPGSSRFYLSLEDPLLRIFAGERVSAHHGAAEDARGRGDRARAWSRARSRTRSARSRRATSTSASSCSNTTTSPTTSAR